MEHLWSPWRYDYIASAGATPAKCPFCVDEDTSPDKDRLIVYRGTHNFIILNLYPYTLGHFMVAPYTHMAKLDEAPPQHPAALTSLNRIAVFDSRGPPGA